VNGEALAKKTREGAAWLSGRARALYDLLQSSQVARARAQLFVAVCIVACGRTSPAANAPDTSVGAGPSLAAALVDAGEGGARDSEYTELWSRAADGTEEDSMRLARALGPEGLVAGATSQAARLVAIRAMAFSDGFAGLPWLGDVAAGEDVALAKEAADSAVAMAARGRDQNDPEDAEEMRAGCTKLVAIAKNGKHDKTVRIRAVRILRLLAERGCVKVDDIPTDFDLSP
jgi:hypothetical protein